MGRVWYVVTGLGYSEILSHQEKQSSPTETSTLCIHTHTCYSIKGCMANNELTRYRSEDKLTRMRSSPIRTFSPSDLCLEAGWIVHQQASPRAGRMDDNSHHKTPHFWNLYNSPSIDPHYFHSNQELFL